MVEDNYKKKHIIDNSVRDRMSLLDKYGYNFFSEKLSIITQYAPYREYVEMDVPIRTLEYLIILVRKGTSVLNISFCDYKLMPGTLLLVPAECILINKKQSDDYDCHSIAFRIPMSEKESLFDLGVVSLQLTDASQQIVDNYIFMMRQLASDNKADRGSMGYLIMSLLFLIREWYQEQNKIIYRERKSSSAELCTRFFRLINANNNLHREPSYYADMLGVTKGYLSQCVRENSDKTMMEWINEKTLLEAKRLLKTTDRLLEDIAIELQLKSSPQFVKFFKKHTGETPNAFRKRTLR